MKFNKDRIALLVIFSIIAIGTVLAALSVKTEGNFSVSNGTIEMKMPSDSYSRFYVDNNGNISFGPGSSAVDINLYRKSANLLATDDMFAITSIANSVYRFIRYASNGTAANTWLLSGQEDSDANARIRMFVNGKIEWGAGGASAVDTNLYRSTNGTLKTDDNLIIVGNLTVLGSKSGFVTDFIESAEQIEIGDVVCITGISDKKIKTIKFETTTNELGESYEVKNGEIETEIPVAKVEKCKEAESTKVYGVIAKLPYYGEEDFSNYYQAVILGNFYKIKVDATNKAVKAGDLLTTSSNPGYAIVPETPKLGSIVGKALQNLDSGTGTISVLVTLK